MKNLSNFITESNEPIGDIAAAIKTIQTQDKIIMVMSDAEAFEFLYIWKGQFDKICATYADSKHLICSFPDASDDVNTIMKKLAEELEKSKYKDDVKTFISALKSSHKMDGIMVITPSSKLMDKLEDLEEKEI